MNQLCKFNKYYKDTGNESYNLFVISLFYYDKYTRLGNKGVYSNKTIERQLTFFRNILANIESLYNGCIPDDWKIRIYYDSSLLNFKYNGKKIWKFFLEFAIKLDKVQLVKFECPKYYNKSKCEHIKLFGTLIRFYPLFNYERNVKSINCIDADNCITKKWMNELVKFVNSKYQINVFCSKYEFPRYRDFETNDKFKCYFRAGIFSSKIFFKYSEWKRIFNDIENPESNFTKTYKKIIDKMNIFFPNEFKNKENTFYEFGFDEIFLNYFIKKLIEKNHYSIRYVHYRPSINVFIDYLLMVLKNPVNKVYTQELLDNKNSPYNTIDELYEDLKNSIKKRTFFKKILFLKKNIYILEKMNIDPILIKFIKCETKKTFFQYPHFASYLKMLK